MARFQSDNEKVIRNAFQRFSADKQGIIAEGMKKVAQAGLSFLVDAHDQHQDGMSHTEEDNTMGYAVAHNGQVVESGLFQGDGGDISGDAKEEAERLVSGTTGWVAIILSDMEGWYRVDWEMNFLQLSADKIRSNFFTFFKPVKR